ncbi:MAG TPA: hypothetical protein VF532_02515 [Candidatus Angelobacter sp.]
MSTAALKTPVEQPKPLVLVDSPKAAVETAIEEGNPVTPIIAAFVLAFIGATMFVGFFAAWIYFLRNSGVMAP